MSLYREVQMKGKMEITDKKLDEVLGGENMRPSVKHEVAYWRKFNALHRYFNNHFNDGDGGNDNCVNMYMDFEDITELLRLVKQIRKQVIVKDDKITNPEVCGALPTEDGFFFGSTDYNEYYVYNLDETIKQLSKVVKEHYALLEAGVKEYEISYYYRAWY